MELVLCNLKKGEEKWWFVVPSASIFSWPQRVFTLDGANCRQYLLSVEGGKINSHLDLASAVFFFFLFPFFLSVIYICSSILKT